MHPWPFDNRFSRVGFRQKVYLPSPAAPANFLVHGDEESPLMVAPFQPAIALMNRLKYPRKFLLISLLFAVPFAYTLTELFGQIQSRIQFTHKEIYGTAYLRPLMELMQVSQARDLEHDILQGQPVEAALQQQSRIDKIWQRLEFVEQKYGIALQSSAQFAALKQSWRELKVAAPSLSPSESNARYAKFIKDIRTIISYVGDTSNLILDPDLDTYYIMDSVLLKLPESVELLAQSRSFKDTFVRQTVSAEEKAKIVVLAGLIQANTSAMQTGIETAIRNNPAKNLKPALQSPLQECVIARSQLLKILEHKANSPSSATSPLDAYVTSANAALNSSFRLWNLSVAELDRLLQARIDGFAKKRTLIIVVTLIALVVVLYLWIGFYLAVMDTVSSLKQASRRMLSGDIAGVVRLDTRDELAQVVKSFNEVLAQLFRANQEINALNERLKAENLRMAAELEVTRQLQQMLLPKQEELSQIAGLDIAGFMEPAAEVGGDYYDVLQHNGLVKIGIGDVTGHGLESGVLTIMAQTAVRTLMANDETNAVKFLSALNRTIYENVQRMNSDKNMTLTLIDYHQGILSLSGQHEEIIVVRSSGKVERIDTIDLGFPIGLAENIADFVAEAKVQLNSGDVVVLYTDGITEAENRLGVHYGLERLCEVVSRNCQKSASVIKQAAIDDLRQHIGEQKVYDDITLLVLKQK